MSPSPIDKHPLGNRTILSQGMISKALIDPRFYDIVPEFLTLKPKLQALNVDIKKPGCSSCKQRKIQSTMYKDFLYVVGVLSQSGIDKLKSYFKVNELMVNLINRSTGAVEFKVF